MTLPQSARAHDINDDGQQFLESCFVLDCDEIRSELEHEYELQLDLP